MISSIPYLKIATALIMFVSCQRSELKEISTLPKELIEISAATVLQDSVLWTLEDHGNAPHLYAINYYSGELLRTVKIKGIENKDWEALTADENGNLYIGDIGNNKGKRKKYYIHQLKVSPENSWQPQTLTFTLPKKIKHSDFESLFYWNDHFYAFTKENGKAALIKLKKDSEEQEAKILTYFNLKGDTNKITDATISNDGKTVILLNHDKVWKLTNFEEDNFFSGRVERIDFFHESQKEGVCFIDKNTLLITDERANLEGGKCYIFKLP